MGYGFKHGGSSVASVDALSFRFVGGVIEPTPKQNDIWINTETPVSCWSISASEPTPYHGKVWLVVPGGAVSFNAVKENNIEISPSDCKQFVDGAWVDKEAHICIDSKWEKVAQGIMNLILYGSGTANAEFDLTYTTIGETNIKMDIYTKGTATIKTKETYALDNFSKVEVDYSEFFSNSTLHPTLTLSVETDAGEVVESSTVTHGTQNSGTISIPIDLLGEYKIKLAMINDSSANSASVLITGIRIMV